MFRIISLIFISIFLFTDSVVAQERWPAKPVRWIVPYAAGGFGLKANNLQELIACAKANSGQLVSLPRVSAARITCRAKCCASAARRDPRHRQ